MDNKFAIGIIFFLFVIAVLLGVFVVKNSQNSVSNSEQSTSAANSANIKPSLTPISFDYKIGTWTLSNENASSSLGSFISILNALGQESITKYTDFSASYKDSEGYTMMTIEIIDFKDNTNSKDFLRSLAGNSAENLALGSYPRIQQNAHGTYVKIEQGWWAWTESNRIISIALGNYEPNVYDYSKADSIVNFYLDKYPSDLTSDFVL